MSFEATGDEYRVEKVRQTEVEDVFYITNLRTGESVYEKFPRTMELTAEDVLSYYE